MQLFGITDLTQYVLGVIFIILLPGPNSLYVATVAARRGVKAGFAGACGIFTGDAILMGLTILGAASLMKTFPLLFFVLKYAGGIYLAWLGGGMLVSAWRRWHSDAPIQIEPAKEALQQSDSPYRKALLISLINPKAILFFLSFFIQFVDNSYPHPAFSFLILGVILQFFSALYLTGLILAGDRLANEFRRRHKVSVALSGMVGAVFVGFGGKLAASTMN